VILRRTLTIMLTLGLALTALAPAVSAQVAAASAGRPVEDQQFSVSTVVPEAWTDYGGGIYTRGTPPDDPALIAIQSAATTPDQLWQRLLPQLALSEVPESTGEFTGDALTWDLYHVDISLPGIEVAVELGLAEQDGTTYIVMLQSAPEEFDALRESVLLPALEATAPLAPEPTPDPSTFDYSIEEVAFPGGSEGVELAGTLTLPSGPGPHPVVVTMSGSGPQDRDESLKPITALKPFAVLADALTNAGVGVLRYDDRGVGGSTGDYNAATVQELASDARAAIDYLETRDEVDPERIGLFGHSEGGLYAAMLGASDARVAWIGMMAPAAVDGVSLIVAQNEALQRAEGESEEVVEAVTDYTAEVMPLARDGDVAAVEALAIEFYGSLWDSLGEREQAVLGERDAFAAETAARDVELYTSGWFRSVLAYDPRPDWSRVTVPVLAVFGGKDVQVIAERNATALAAALEAAGNDRFEIVTIADANHLFQEADSGAFSEYVRLKPEFVDGFVELVVDWTADVAGVAE
jgi:hypothetical protein